MEWGGRNYSRRNRSLNPMRTIELQRTKRLLLVYVKHFGAERGYLRHCVVLALDFS